MIKIEKENSTAILDYFKCEVSPKGAVIVCPGGGYSFLSPREAEPVAKAFNQCGYHAFVLYYDVEKEVLGDLPLHQLAEAVKYVNSHKKEYDLEGKSVTVCGFSAGGHLAASLGILWNNDAYFVENSEEEKQLRKPDGMILCYPVVSSSDIAHRGSMERLAGVDRNAQERYSLEKLVDETAVSTFIWGTAEDDAVPVENSILLLNALIQKKIPVEYHLYPFGVHGLSLVTKEVEEPEKKRFADLHVARWMEQCGKWLDEIMQGGI